MNTKDLLHLLIPIGLMLLPFMHVDNLKYMYFVPILLPLLWLLLGKCPMTSSNQNKKGGFILLQMRKIFPTITKRTSENLITFTLLLIVIVSAYKIMMKYGVYR